MRGDAVRDLVSLQIALPKPPQPKIRRIIIHHAESPQPLPRLFIIAAIMLGSSPRFWQRLARIAGILFAELWSPKEKIFVSDIVL